MVRRWFVALVLVLGLAACGPASDNLDTSAQPAPPATNDFIPEDQNLSDCLGSLPAPNCGSESKGGWQSYLVMGIMAAGLAFIGWRITVGVRARDRALDPTTK